MIIEPLHIDPELRLQEEREREEQQGRGDGQQQQQQQQDSSVSGCVSPHESLVAAVRAHITTRVPLPLPASAAQRSGPQAVSGASCAALGARLRLLFRMGMTGSFRRYDLSEPAAWRTSTSART